MPNRPTPSRPNPSTARRPRRKPAHHTGSYQADAARVVDAARRNPDTRCWRCGLRIENHRRHRNGRRAFWTAGHVRDGDPTSPLRPEASVCNFRAGGKLGARRRARRRGNPTSRQWLT